MSDRRTQIAEAGVRIVASRGVRSLTHRAIDTEIGLPDGSTSYYARSRRELLSLIVHHLADRTEAELIAPRLPATITPAVVADLLVDELDATAQRSDDHRARLLLWLECHSDPELRAVLATRPESVRAYAQTASAVLELLEVANPDAQAPNLVGLLDSLRLQRVAGTARIDDRAVVTAYLVGLPKAESQPSRSAANPAATARGLLSRIRRTR